MTLIAFGEIRYLDGGEATLFVRFARPDGTTFDMSLSEAQFVELVAGLGEGQEAAPPSPAKTAASNPLDDEDEDDEVEDSRPFSVASRYADDDL
jgi:hypothetical protein